LIYFSSIEASRDQLDNERSIQIEQLTSQAPLFEDYQKQIGQLQRDLCQKDDERTILQDRLNQVEFELRRTLDDQISTTSRLEVLVEERNAFVEQQNLQKIEL
jgi:hypothetical protein